MKKLIPILCLFVILSACGKQTGKPSSGEQLIEKPSAGEGEYALSLMPDWSFTEMPVAQDKDVPDFLTADQQDLFRSAKRMYDGLKGCSAGYKPNYDITIEEPMGANIVQYALDEAFETYADFDTALHAVFTDEFCAKLLPTQPNNPVMEREGKLYSMLADRGGNISFISQSYEIISESEAEIQFNFVGVYNEDIQSDIEKRDKTKDVIEKKAVKMILTDKGWRFDEFAIMY